MPVPRNKRKRTSVDNSTAGSPRRRRESVDPESTGTVLPTVPDITGSNNTGNDGNDQANPEPKTLPQQDELIQQKEIKTEKGVVKAGETTAAPSITTANITIANPPAPTPPPTTTAPPPTTDSTAPEQSAPGKELLSPDRIKSFLLHRKLLLQRLQQGRTACQKRLPLIPPVENEVAAFAQSCRQATSLARKQSRTETSNEKSTLSLRRGSSVGKRMSLALSSLTPAERSSSVTPAAQRKRPESAPLSRSSSVPAARTMPSSTKTAAAAATATAPNKSATAMQAAAAARRSSMSSAAAAARAKTTPVVRTEMVALRERRHKLRIELKTKLAPQPNLPVRRQTHWDKLLQEMRWMATDFREERKWKRAANQTLAQESLEHIKAKNEVQSPPPVVREEPETEEKVEEQVEKMEVCETDKRPPRYMSVSSEDAKEAKGVAHRLSETLTKHVASLLVSKEENITIPTLPKVQISGEEKTQLLEDITQRVKAIEAFRHSNDDTDDKDDDGLSPAQRDVLLAMEDWWKFRAGTVLQGTLACGKTVLACALLWRNRAAPGPQLVLCPTTRLVRWEFELSRFGDLNIKTMGKDSAEIDLLGVGDVLVCDQMSVYRLCKSKLVGKIQSVVVDCRHGAAFEGSRQPTCLGQATSLPPQTLCSPEWWNAVVQIAGERRLIIENLTSRSKPPRYIEGLPPRETLEILALRTVFLLGEDLLSKPQMAARVLLSWARKRVEKKKKTLLEAVRRTILSCAEPLHFCLDASPVLDHLPSAVWDVRSCEMTELQEESYARCCREVQSVLSRGLGGRPDQVDLVSQAMLRLRRHCSHAEFSAFFLTTFQRLHAQKYTRNPSQLSFSTAHDILEGSCKLQALMSFLIYDCALKSLPDHLEPLVKQSSIKMIKRKRASQKLEKIVVLAALPELQVMTSVLLNSLGIDHHLLIQPEEGIPEEASLRTWMDHQSVLAEFNRDCGEAYRLLVSSVDILGSDHGGLSIENADVVVCLDEDWSGRGEMLLYSILARSLHRREQDDENPCRFIRLVSSDSCEMAFLKPSKTVSGRNSSAKSKSSADKIPMALHPMGWFDATAKALSKDEEACVRDCWRSLNVTASCFVFPASNFLAFRDVDLALVLAADDLPPLLTSRHDPRFLPVDQEEDRISTEIAFLSTMITKEVNARQGIFKAEQDYFDFLMSYEATRTSGCAYGYGKSLSAFLQRFATIVDSSSLGTSLQRLNLTVPMTLIGTETPLANGEPETLDSSSSSSNDGPTCIPSSFLFYQSSNPSKMSLGARTNLYACAFDARGASAACSDGNQGSEPLVYFPPLFPRVLESSLLAKNDAALLRSRASHASFGLGSQKKRPVDVPAASHPSKRPRPEAMGAQSIEGSIQVDGISAPAKEADGATTAIASTTKAATQSESQLESALLELQEDYGAAGIGAVPLPRDSALSSAHAYTDTTSTHSGIEFASGWSPLPGACDPEEMERMLREPNNYMGSVVLFVSRKRQRGYNGRSVATLPPNRAQQIRTPGSTAWTGNPTPPMLSAVPNGPNGMLQDVNGSSVRKGTKKNLVTQREGSIIQSSAFTRFPLVDPTGLPRPGEQVLGAAQAPKAKDLYKKGLLASLRQTGIGSTLFEATAFRAASERVKKRVESRLIRHCWTSSSTFEVGPGLPLHISKMHSPAPSNRMSFKVNSNLWTSIVKRLKSPDIETGTEALELARKQRAAFHRSLVIPCRVDFGPFQSGFLSAPSGMTAVSPPRLRAGVSLPMGVKVSSLLKDQARQSWKVDDDKMLQLALTRYGMNWLLAASSLRGFEQFKHVHRPDVVGHDASRCCRERWQTMVREDHSLVQKARETEKAHRSVFVERSDCFANGLDGGECENGVMYGSFCQSSENQKEDLKTEATTVFLLPPREKEAVSTEGSKPMVTDNGRPKRRSFAALLRARTKVQKNTIPIPGLTSGSPPTTGPPSHASHIQAVEAALTASSSSGRKEMWPLQILASNRKRQAAVATAASSSSSAAPSPPRKPSSTASRSGSSNPSHSNGRASSTSRPATKHASAPMTTQQRNSYKKSTSGKTSPTRSSQPAPQRSTATAQSFVPPTTTPNPISSQPTSTSPRKVAPEPNPTAGK